MSKMEDVNDDVHKCSAKLLLADLEKSLASNNLSEVYNHLALLDSLEAKSHPIYSCFSAIKSSDKTAAVSKARNILKKWRSDLKEGDYIDKFSAIDSVKDNVVFYRFK